MNLNEYIASGILEAYALGSATDKERREVECLSKIHPEIAEELQAICDSIEQLALAQSVTPPASLKDKILEQLEPRVIPLVAPEEVPHQHQTEKKKSDSQVYKLVASVAIIVAAAFMGLFLKNQAEISTVQADLAAISTSRQSLAAELESLKGQIAQNNQLIAFFQDTATVDIQLDGIPEKSKQSYATVFWNKTSNESYLRIGYLPKPPQGKQYQLWAIVDGQPVDMGVFDVDNSLALQEITTISNAQALAVTLEDEGGSPVPTLSEMYVMGEV